uniref:Uncharacterized protein n=1 Tax=Arundo donax TaxID=35708 RepID=A0A0A8ZNR2_ARUDO
MCDFTTKEEPTMIDKEQVSIAFITSSFSTIFFFLSLQLSSLVLIATDDECSLFRPLGHHSIPYRASFYADDMVVFLSPIAYPQ